jgi:hypothetical protein
MSSRSDAANREMQQRRSTTYGRMIKTASWFTKLPADHVRIGISRGVPSKQKTFRIYPALNPGSWFKSCAPPQEYAHRYFDILSKLNPETVLYELIELADGHTALLCWEAAPPNQDWCHRALVSAWLFDELALEVPEYGWEGQGAWLAAS